MKIFDFFDSFRLLINKKYDLVFYSENKNYNKLFSLAVEDLSKIKSLKILYATSDKEDKLDYTNVENIYLGKNFILSILFNLIQTKILITTTSDLGNNLLKKNNKKKIIFIFPFSRKHTQILYKKCIR